MASNKINKDKITFSDSSVIVVDGRRFLVKDISFPDIRCHFTTGRSIRKPGIGQCVNYEYRTGVMTDIGDIEESEWVALASYLIEREGEQELLNWMLEWYKSTDKRANRTYVLECHVARLFDDENWCDYVPFNTKYRPEKLKGI